MQWPLISRHCSSEPFLVICSIHFMVLYGPGVYPAVDIYRLMRESLTEPLIG